MNVNLLVDAIVRQTTVLIAQLATASGARATLAHTANQVFVDLVDELKAQGLGSKVIADMFGLSLRTYHDKVSRLSESSTERGHSLWEALLSFIDERKTVLRSDVLLHFAHDEELKVRAVLRDLVDSNLVFRSGRGDATVYRAVEPDEMALSRRHGSADAFRNLVWIAVYRAGPISIEELLQRLPAEEAALASAVDGLLRDGLIARDGTEEPARYVSQRCVISESDPAGWEAAVFDHYQAVVTAVTTKLRLGKHKGMWGEFVGGSTYGVEIWDGHPHRADVLGFLKQTRERAVAIRELVASYNAEHPAGEHPVKVISYVGQTVVLDEEDGTPNDP